MSGVSRPALWVFHDRLQGGPVSGLETMTVEEHRVDASEIYQRCSRCGRLGLELPIACTCINFRTMHAVIWLTHGASQEVVEHERAHGRGYDHPNGELRRQYAVWTNRGGRRTTPPVDTAYSAEASLAKAGELRSAARTE